MLIQKSHISISSGVVKNLYLQLYFFLLNAARIRNDTIVLKRISALKEHQIATFSYHCDNECYKNYIHKGRLKHIEQAKPKETEQPTQDHQEVQQDQEQCQSGSSKITLTRSREDSTRNPTCKLSSDFFSI